MDSCITSFLFNIGFTATLCHRKEDWFLLHYFDILCWLQSGNWTHTHTLILSAQTSAASQFSVLFFSQQTSPHAATAVFFCCHDSSYLSRRWEVAWFRKWIHHDQSCLQEARVGCIYAKGVDVCVSFCLFVLTVTFPVCVHVFVRMFALLKGLAQSRPFVVGSSGLPTQLVWFMDVRQNCISLWPEKDCPTSWCETPINVPTLTA